MRIGIGYDSHRLVKGRKLILGGIEIPFEKGLLGHSDGDVLIHAIIDSIIGAVRAGDIGRHFSDKDPQWKGVSSIKMLKIILELLSRKGFGIGWIDSTVIAEMPRLSPYIDRMIYSLEEAGIPEGTLNIKAKTNEGMGFTGRGEGIVAMAATLLVREQEREEREIL